MVAVIHFTAGLVHHSDGHYLGRERWMADVRAALTPPDAAEQEVPSVAEGGTGPGAAVR